MIGGIDHFVDRFVDRFVDQQIWLWQEGRRIRERKGVEGNLPRPRICVSRECAGIGDPNHYDLVVNAGTLGVEGAAAQVVDAFRLRFGAVT